MKCLLKPIRSFINLLPISSYATESQVAVDVARLLLQYLFIQNLCLLKLTDGLMKSGHVITYGDHNGVVVVLVLYTVLGTAVKCLIIMGLEGERGRRERGKTLKYTYM